MLLTIAFESDIPLYQQIKNQIITGIAQGKLKPGESLPSVRQLATDIGINFHTVNKVYQQLKQEQWVVIHRKSGVIINPDLNLKADKAYRESLASTLTVLFAEAHLRGMTMAESQQLIETLYRSFVQEVSK
ncbi:MAG: GntR family transcriptional regulator [Bacillota bacterium]|nr:GntR family transcriptional regulator [Bacillota bacterium]MDW7678225.1 GntR family transcriptional regulator [Bacillota bacterium]